MENLLNLQPGERMLMHFRKHWFILFLRLLGIAVVAILPFAGFLYAGRMGIIPPLMRDSAGLEFAAYFWLLVIWWTIAGVWTKYYLEIWAVTNRRLLRMEQINLFNREVSVWGIERISEATVRHANVIETLLDFGTLEIQTAGQADKHETVHGVPNPERVREIIMREASRIGELEETNNNQEQLLHTISHEVKSYLTKDAASLAYIAEGGANSSEIRSFAKTALDETRKGVSAVMNILAGSDVKEGTMQFVSERFDLKPVILELFEHFKPIAERKGIAFTLSADDSTYMIHGDSTKLQDLVLRNLVDNALRYTPGGSVEIHVSKDSKMFYFRITDTGIGISDTDMQRLFKAGGKGEHSSDVNPDSTGFGLDSAKKALDAHKGTISVHSQGTGQGSTFIVTLPLAG